MCWHFNPAEPSAQPTRPYPFDADYQAVVDHLKPANPNAPSVVDLFTRGRCADCLAIPKVWRLEIPLSVGNEWSQYYAGTVYLFREPYDYAGVFTGFFDSKCTWGQLDEERLGGVFKGENSYRGRWNDGWHLTYDRDGWGLYTPTESGTILFEPDAKSRYNLQGSFNCLGPNVAYNPQTVAQYPFPFLPPTLSIEPYYP